MKEGWEYKKLGEVCKINSGRSIKASEIENKEQNGYVPCYGGNGIRGYVKEISHQGMYPIVGRVGALCGNVHLATGAFYATEHALVVSCNDNNIKKEWLAKYLESQSLGKYAKGVAQPVIAAGELSKLHIAIPPLPIQQSIVSELDEINNLLSLKRKELETYDKLAQSLFYEMFGDPVENEKGWEVKKWNDVLRIINGKNQRVVENANGIYPIYGSGGIMGYANDWLCPENCTIIGRKGNINKPIFVKTKFWNVDTAFGLNANAETLSPLYLYYFCLNYNFERHNKAVTIPSLTKTDLLNIDIPLPPFPLQQLFAQRIEAIEEQKVHVKAAIEKLETLLAARMQYWFD